MAGTQVVHKAPAECYPAENIDCPFMTPDDYCQQKAAASGSSFYYSFRFLPPEKRRAITALYAFCRAVDDTVDECVDPGVAGKKLDWWREEIHRTCQGTPSHPVSHALGDAIQRYGLAEEYFQEIIDGMAMDLVQHHYANFSELSLYCYRVASVVGLLAAEIFGYTNRLTLKYAHDLGTAFQLTNIIRDVREDAARGRIYLPQDELQRFGVRPADILSFNHSPAFEKLIRFQVSRAQSHYAKALQQLPAEDRFAQSSGLVMAAIYRATLDEIERDDCRVLAHRIALTPLRKLWIAWRTARREKRLARPVQLAASGHHD